MWSSCNSSGERFGTDGHYVVTYRDGMWQPIMTVQEWQQIRERKIGPIAPLPVRPVDAPRACEAPTTTSTTSPTSSTTSTSSTSTTSTTSTTTAPVGPAPVISGESPDSGPETGGQTIQVLGSGFTGATAVNFGTTPAQSFVVQSDTLILAVTPVLTPGSYEVTVTTPWGVGASPSWDWFLAGGGA